MDIRSQRLRELFDKSGYSQTEICNKTGITKGALSSYLSGRYSPKQQALEKLAIIFDVPIQYLMGYDIPHIPKTWQSQFADSLDKYSDECNLEQSLQLLLSKHEEIGDFQYSEKQLHDIITYAIFLKEHS